MHFAAAALFSFGLKCSFQLSAFSYQLDRGATKSQLHHEIAES